MMRTSIWLLVCLVAAVTARAAAGGEPSWPASLEQDLLSASRAYEADAASGAAALGQALVSTAKRLQMDRHTLKSPKDLDGVVSALEGVAKLGVSEPAALWRALAATGHAKALQLLTAATPPEALSSLEQLRALATSVIESRSGSAHAWLVHDGDRLLEAFKKVGSARQVAEASALEPALACAARTLCFPQRGEDRRLNDNPRKASTEVTRAVIKSLAAASPAWQAMLAGALARTPCPATRRVLKKWAASGHTPEVGVLAMLRGLSKAGDSDAVPLILAQVKDTSPRVLQASMVALGGLPKETLRRRGRDIVDGTLTQFDRDSMEIIRLTARRKRKPKDEARLKALSARGKSWHTEAIVDDNPAFDLPDGVRGLQGLYALWWRVIDTKPSKLMPPRPSETARPKFLNGRPNLQYTDWVRWWRGSR